MRQCAELDDSDRMRLLTKSIRQESSRTLNVAVVGAGPVGYLVVLDALIRFNVLPSDLTLNLFWVVRDSGKREALRKHGLRFKLEHEFPSETMERITARATLEKGLTYVESLDEAAELSKDIALVVACVKAYSVNEVLDSVLNNLPGTSVMLIANGLLELKTAVLGVLFGGGAIIDGELRLTDMHRLEYGLMDEPDKMFKPKYCDLLLGELSSKLKEDFISSSLNLIIVSSFFTNCGFIETHKSDNVFNAVLSKVITNSVINPLTAIFDAQNSVILSEKMTPLVSGLVSEICAVFNVEYCNEIAAGEMRNPDTYNLNCDNENDSKSLLELDDANDKHGIALFRPDTELERVLDIARNTALNFSSMLQDIRTGRPTEIPWLNGKIVELGAKHGMKTPLNEWVVRMVEVLGERSQ